MRIKFKGKLLKIERWKRIVEYPNFFISSKGRLWSLKKHSIGHGNEDKDGYYRHTFGNGHVNIRIHKLVATHFIPNPNNLETIDHIDNNKHNNDISNLQWLSRGDNSRKRHKGTTHISEKKMVVCLNPYRIYPTIAEAARDTGCYASGIMYCCKGIHNYTYADYPSREKKLQWRYATKDEIEMYKTKS